MSFFQVIIKVVPMQLTKYAFVGLLSILSMDSGPSFPLGKSILMEGQEVFKEELVLNPLEGVWYYEGHPFTGYALNYHPNGVLAEQIGYFQGKKEGMTRKWFSSGMLRSQGNYVRNRLNGEYKSWWPNGVLSTTSRYKMGVKHGEQCKWYPTGQLARVTRLNLGKEEGLQQAWLASGKIYANYEAKNGRFFGLKRSNLCYELKDEIVQK